MCFHTSQTKKVIELESRFKVSLYDDEARDAYDIPSYHLNGYAHPDMLIIPQEAPSSLVIGRWGIAPSNTNLENLDSYYKEAVSYGAGLNAQSEKLFNHFIYKHSALTRRCIIPVTGFFEPHEYKTKKYPYHIKDKDDNLLSLAGIYTVVENYITFSILTKSASPLFEKIHNLKKRQPIILDEISTHNWLSHDLNEMDIEEIITLNYDDTKLSTYTVSKDLFSPKVNSNIPTITDKVEYQELNTLF